VAVDIRAVSGSRDLKAFIELPFRVHANHPQWVPPLKLERRMFLNRRMNPFFTHGEAEYFLARRDGQVLGRASAQINHSFNDTHQAKWGWFGFLELFDDQEVAGALLDAAAEWLRARGMERMVGPADFSMNDESGILVEGYELRPMLRQPWHPPYYRRLVEAEGLEKAMDLLMWNLEVSDRSRVMPGIEELAGRLHSEHGISVRRMRRLRMRSELDRFAEVYNSAWSENWDFVPYSKKDLDSMALEFQLVFDKHWAFVAERDDTGEVVAMAFTFPDLNQVLARMNGRLLPFGWWQFARKGRIMDRVRVGFLGVKPEYQHTGVAAKLYIEHFKAASERRQSGGEMGWILETNTAMNRGMEGMGGRVVKRYRVYQRPLAQEGPAAESRLGPQ
jgi:GNAT superfamily N-acetyltransferase